MARHTQISVDKGNNSDRNGKKKHLVQGTLDALWRLPTTRVRKEDCAETKTLHRHVRLDSRVSRQQQLTIKSFLARATKPDSLDVLKNPLSAGEVANDTSLEAVFNTPPSNWPRHVAFITDYRNPSGIVFDSIPPYRTCACDTVCRSGTCENAAANIFCSRNCCNYDACGNALKPRILLQLVRNSFTFGFGVYAAQIIDAGVIIGEYLGELTVLRSDEVRKRQGYLVQMKAIPLYPKNSTVYIDATYHGNMTRYLNHSCNASTRFEELSNEDRHTVVVVTIREIQAGEQITVEYKGKLWFECQCGAPMCRSLDINQ